MTCSPKHLLVTVLPCSIAESGEAQISLTLGGFPRILPPQNTGILKIPVSAVLGLRCDHSNITYCELSCCIGSLNLSTQTVSFYRGWFTQQPMSVINNRCSMLPHPRIKACDNSQHPGVLVCMILLSLEKL